MKAMKGIIGIVTLMIMGTITMTGQTEIGIRTGVAINSSEISGMVGDIVPDTRSHLGYSIGVYADVAMNRAFSFHPELGFTTKGFSMDQGTNFDMLGLDIPIGVRAETNMRYVEALTLMRYKMGSGPLKAFVEAGPGMGIATSAHIQPRATFLLEFNLPQIDIDLAGDTYNRTDVSAHIGTGVEYDTGQGIVSANVRYSHGLANVLNDPIINTRITHRAVNVGVAYGYRF